MRRLPDKKMVLFIKKPAGWVDPSKRVLKKQERSGPIDPQHFNPDMKVQGLVGIIDDRMLPVVTIVLIVILALIVASFIV